MNPISWIEIRVGGRGNIACDAKQRAEGIERIEAAIETKREFIEISL